MDLKVDRISLMDFLIDFFAGKLSVSIVYVNDIFCNKRVLEARIKVCIKKVFFHVELHNLAVHKFSSWQHKIYDSIY